MYWWETGGWQYYNTGSIDSLFTAYPEGYTFIGDADLITLQEMLAPQGLLGQVRWAVEEWARVQGVTLLTLHIREDEETWPLSRYTAWVHVHGSPMPPALVTALVVLMIVALAAVTLRFVYTAVRYGPTAAIQETATPVLELAQQVGETTAKFAERAGQAAGNVVGNLGWGVAKAILPLAAILVGLALVASFVAPKIASVMPQARMLRR